MDAIGVFERSVQDPCSLDLDEQDEQDELCAIRLDGTLSLAPTVSFTNVGLDPLEEEDPLGCENGRGPGSTSGRGRKASVSSTSSYMSDASSHSKMKPPGIPDQRFKNPFKGSTTGNTTGNTTASTASTYPNAQLRLRRTMTDPDFPLRPSVLSRRNTSTIIQQMNSANINSNGRPSSMQNGRAGAPSLKRASNCCSASNRNSLLQRSNSAISDGTPSPPDCPSSRSYSRCGSIGIPTHLYSLEKYVSSQLDELATAEYESEEAPATKHQRSNTMAGLVNSMNGENERLSHVEFPGLSRCSSARKKSYIEMSLGNSFAQ